MGRELSEGRLSQLERSLALAREQLEDLRRVHTGGWARRAWCNCLVWGRELLPQGRCPGLCSAPCCTTQGQVEGR